MRAFQRVERNRRLAGKLERVAARQAEPQGRNACRRRQRQHIPRVHDLYHVTTLILAEKEGVRQGVRALDFGPDPAGKRHFRQRDGEAAIGEVMHGARAPLRDQ